jgi:hypothetical protein
LFAAPTTVLGQQRLGNSPAEPSAGGEQGALATPSSMTRCQSHGRARCRRSRRRGQLEHGCDHPESGLQAEARTTAGDGPSVNSLIVRRTLTLPIESSGDTKGKSPVVQRTVLGRSQAQSPAERGSVSAASLLLRSLSASSSCRPSPWCWSCRRWPARCRPACGFPSLTRPRSTSRCSTARPRRVLCYDDEVFAAGGRPCDRSPGTFGWKIHPPPTAARSSSATPTTTPPPRRPPLWA